MNRQRRLLPHVLPAFRKLCRAFEKTFRRMKENVSAFKGKDFGLLKKRFVICGKTFRALHEKNSAFWEKQMRTKKSTPSVPILSGERGKKEGVDVSKYAVCLNKLI